MPRIESRASCVLGNVSSLISEVLVDGWLTSVRLWWSRMSWWEDLTKQRCSPSSSWAAERHSQEWERHRLWTCVHSDPLTKPHFCVVDWWGPWANHLSVMSSAEDQSYRIWTWGVGGLDSQITMEWVTPVVTTLVVIKLSSRNWAWGNTSVIPPTQEDSEFMARLGYLVRPCLKIQNEESGEMS